MEALGGLDQFAGRAVDQGQAVQLGFGKVAQLAVTAQLEFAEVTGEIGPVVEQPGD